MAIVYDGPVLPDDLTVFVREVPLPNLIWLHNLLPDRQVQTNRVDVGTLTKTGRTAKFRAYDAQVHRGQRDVATLTTVKLPPLSDSLSMGELERLQIEFARTGGTNQAAFLDAIYNDAQNLTENVQRRMELARGDVLTDGKFTLAGEGGLTMEADYGLPSGNLVTAGTLWSTLTADIISDLTGWVRTYRNLNGYSPVGMTIDFDVLMNMQRNTTLKAQYATAVASVSNMGMLSRDQVNMSLQTFGLPPILQVYDSQVDVDGTATRVVPDGKVIFTPPDPGTNLGYTAWGLSATSLELVNDTRSDLTFEDAPGIVGIVDKSDAPPFRQTTFVDAVGMPVIENPNALMVATVL
jgi:hypothetical protein